MLDRSPRVDTLQPPAVARTTPTPDRGYEAIRRLRELEATLMAALPRQSSRWKEPTLFFFDRQREAERRANSPPGRAETLAAVSQSISTELSWLCQSVEVRRVARSLAGLRSAAAALAPHCPAARDLLDLLAIPDDEAILVLHPGERAGFKLTVRGVVDLGQFHVLMAAAITGDPSSGLVEMRRLPARFADACRNTGAAIPAGVPMLADPVFQLYEPEAMRPDGTLPTGFAGCEHWLWPEMPLSMVPRVDGMRLVLLGPPACPARWEVVPRFPNLPAELRLAERLSPFRVAEELTRLTGRYTPPGRRSIPQPSLARAA
jgi:hypothetical protein